VGLAAKLPLAGIPSPASGQLTATVILPISVIVLVVVSVRRQEPPRGFEKTADEERNWDRITG